MFTWIGTMTALIASHAAPAATLARVTAVGLVGLVATLLVYLNMPGWVDVGSDGLLVDLRDGKRFVPFLELLAAAVYRETTMGKHFVGVELALRSSERVKIPLGEDQFGASDRAEALCASIRSALEAHERRRTDEDASGLARGGRTASEWATRLRSLGAGANAGPREAPIDGEKLFRITESPDAPAEIRAGAAVALSSSLDAEGRTRLRIAADATASPELTEVLNSAAEGDEEAVVAALDRMKA
jgi:hypothetical protein